MSFPLLDVAPPGAFSFAPLLLILLLAFVAIGASVFLIRHLRRGQGLMLALAHAWFWLLLDVRPVRSNGFASTIVVALIVMGLLSLIMVWVSRKPKNRR